MISIIDMNPNDLNFRENVRFRADSNLDELMQSIKQRGIQSPIKVRKEDNTIIFGHRRTAAAIKLGLDSIPVILESGINDKEANILNLLENMQRKDVTSIEIGRQCDIMLKNTKFKMSLSELAVVLGVNERRIHVCLHAFKSLPPKFRERVTYLQNSQNRKVGDLPENIVFAILNFNRTFKKLTDNELDTLLEETANEKLTIGHINLIGYLVTSGMSMKEALNELNRYTITRVNFVLLKTELASVQTKERIFTKQALFEKIVKKEYPNLLI